MKRVFLALIVAVLVTGGAVRLAAYNPGAHIYIAEHALGTAGVNFYYGALAPDIVWYSGLSPQEGWAWYSAHNYFDFSGFAGNLLDRRFAAGWLTHNQVWGADYFAHGPGYPFAATQPGYVLQKAAILGQWFPQLADYPGTELAHSAVEIAVDLLLKKQDPMMGWKVLMASLLRSQSGPDMLVAAKLARPEVLWPAEQFFRQLQIQYAQALAAPAPADRQAMVQLAVQLAGQFYGVTLKPAQAAAILDAAVFVCRDDYLPPVHHAIDSVRGHMLH